MNVQASSSPIWRLVSRHSDPLVPYRVGSGTPFYCIHPVAGDIATYNKLFELLDSRQSVYGIQVPRARMNGSAVRSLAGLAAEYAAAIIAHHASGPLMLGGYSAGAVIALEVAQCLRRAGRDVRLLVAIDGAPLNSCAELSRWHLTYVTKLVFNVPKWLLSRGMNYWAPHSFRRRFVDRLVFRASGLMRSAKAGGPVRQHVATVAGVVGRAGWKPDHVAFIQALYEALHAYVPQPYGGQVLVFEAQIHSLLEVTQTSRIWAALAPRCECVKLRAHHSNLLDGSAQTRTIAAHLNRAFAELCGGEDRTST